MTLIFEPVHIVYLGLLLAAFVTGLWRVGKWLVVNVEKRIDDRFSVLAADSRAWRAVERDLMELRAELPNQYVRREDYIRGQSVVEAKLDAVAAKLEVVQMQGARRES